MRHPDVKTIITMFSYARPLGSVTLTAFIERFLTPLGFAPDAYNNLVLTIPMPDGSRPKQLWSSHSDTVAHKEGFQTLNLDGDGTLQLSRKSRNAGFSCLGADDTAGIWLMTEMIKAKVPGVYVIHHGEESGCIGSSDLASGNPDFFIGIDHAIAFDRMGYTDVITHQCGLRTASTAFAQSFADIMNPLMNVNPPMEPDDGGVYTDTNEYAHLVPECTNIPVGYFHQHSNRETQDVPYLLWLRDALIAADWSGLVTSRDPSASVARYHPGYYFGRNDDAHPDDDWMYPDDDRDTGRNLYHPSETQILDGLVLEYPEIAASILRAYGVSSDGFMSEVSDYYGEVA
jgi:hypothetical protein